MSRPVSALIGVTLLAALPASAQPRPQKPRIEPASPTRFVEAIDRGLIARPRTDGAVYLGWRLLTTDPSNIAFNVYRQQPDAAPIKLNAEPITRTTDILDPSPPATASRYFIRPVINGVEADASPSVTAAKSNQSPPYISIKADPATTYQKIAIADLDRDGRYDFVLKQPNANVDPYEQYWKKSEGTFKLDAFRSDGKHLWRHDLGWAIEQGMWYSPYVVFDLDGDGSAEIAVKTGEGDPRDADGRVQTGPEYLSILDGMTGKEVTRADWIPRDDFPSYNYYCRNQLAVAYLDGKTPSLIVERGTYNVIKVVAYQYRDKKLQKLWSWSDAEEAGREPSIPPQTPTATTKPVKFKTAFSGQGAHCIRVADIDADGRDEVILGSAVLDDNGTGLWSTGMGHPDHVTVGDLAPDRPGLEIQYGYETRQLKNGICMVDAASGKLLWGLDRPTFHIHSSGLCADLDPYHPGVESYAGERDFPQLRWLMSADGKVLEFGKNRGGLAPRAAYWDADPQRELLVGQALSDFESGKPHDVKIEGAVIAVADLLGDWREEIITTLPGEIRIYTTTIPASDRRPTLMQDPIYRMDVASISQAYMQVPSTTRLPAHEGRPSR